MCGDPGLESVCWVALPAAELTTPSQGKGGGLSAACKPWALTEVEPFDWVVGGMPCVRVQVIAGPSLNPNKIRHERFKSHVLQNQRASNIRLPEKNAMGEETQGGPEPPQHLPPPSTDCWMGVGDNSATPTLQPFRFPKKNLGIRKEERGGGNPTLGGISRPNTVVQLTPPPPA